MIFTTIQKPSSWRSKMEVSTISCMTFLNLAGSEWRDITHYCVVAGGAECQMPVRGPQRDKWISKRQGGSSLSIHKKGSSPLEIAPILHFSCWKLTTFLSMCQNLCPKPSEAHIRHLCSSDKPYKCKWPKWCLVVIKRAILILQYNPTTTGAFSSLCVLINSVCKMDNLLQQDIFPAKLGILRKNAMSSLPYLWTHLQLVHVT